MYQVVELYGAFEPWWFLDDWKDDIIKVQHYDTFDEAMSAFKKQWTHLRVSHPFYKSRASLLAAFWDTKHQTWCDDCEESLQEYHSLALLKNWEELPEDEHQQQFERRNDPVRPLSACQLKKIG
ncbi:MULTISPECIES: DUF1033 family protein [unclassified Streptococcus]|uniref:DUF1033 family protein n=1 Tax=unclassified Streptococcus TaxID=2608887 RepID=UPI00359CD2BD